MSSVAGSAFASCRALFAPDQVVELRVLGANGRNGFKFNAAGWFSDHEKLAEAAEQYESKTPAGIYVTINKLAPACIARTDNTIVERIKDTTSDRDVTRRLWLPIDFDPVRPAGVSSSMEELNNAKVAAKAAITELTDMGMPEPLVAHSGNGIHVLYRIDMPTDEESKVFCKAAIEAISDRFSTKSVKIDSTMFNAARILRLWGTSNRKGESTEERPHRFSALWTKKSFSEFEVAQNEVIRKIISKSTRAEKQVKSKERAQLPASPGEPRTATARVDLDAFIEKNRIEYVRKDSYDGTGVRYILKACLFDSSHTGTSAVIGRGSTGSIFYKCHHDSCSSRKWGDVRSLFSNGPDAAHAYAAGDRSLGDKASKGDGDTPWQLAIKYIDQAYSAEEFGRLMLRRHREIFYSYKEKLRKYVPISKDAMKVDVTRWLGESGYGTTLKTVNDVINSISSIVTVPDTLDLPLMTSVNRETMCVQVDPAERNMMTLKNGILDIEALLNGQPFDKCLGPHTPEWFAVTALPFSFPCSEEEARFDTFKRFISEAMDGDEERIAIIQEMFGYCFWRNSKLEKYFILRGFGNDGKSTLLELLQAMLGEENYSSLSLDQLTDPVMITMLYQKMANICNDMKEADGIEEGVLKRVTSGERLTANRKYLDPLQFRTTAKMIFSCNQIPKFDDTTLGIWRRMIIVPFDCTVPEDRIDINLKDKLLNEMPGIFLWAMHGAIRLRQNQKFTESARSKEALREHRAYCFPVLSFMEECMQRGGECRLSTVWSAYRMWCTRVGLSKPKHLHSFARDITNFYPDIRKPTLMSGNVSDVVVKGMSLRIGIPSGE